MTLLYARIHEALEGTTDDDETDSVSLFEDTLIEEELKLAEQAEAEAEAETKTESEAESHEEDLSGQEDTESELDENAQEEDDAHDIKSLSFANVPSWLPWTITAFSLLLTITGGVVLWSLSTSPLPDEYIEAKATGFATPVEPTRQNISQPPSPENNMEMAEQEEEEIRKEFNLSTLTLTPFLIPVQKEGELVFLKLRVELILPDQKTLFAIRKRKAWIRDAVYSVLKGIELKPGMKGDVLLRYRRPVLEKLNKEFAPLEIQDIRLMGVMLK
jgi:flagellar basal body-associated protein FliL